MANDMNLTVLVGRITRDAELKYTNTGTAVTKFSIAVNKKRKKGEEYIEKVSFFDITAWAKMAENLSQYLVKGKQIIVSGELEQDRWEDKDGNKRSKVGITANAIQLLGGDKRQESAPRQDPKPAPHEKPGEFDPNDFANSDIPF